MSTVLVFLERQIQVRVSRTILHFEKSDASRNKFRMMKSDSFPIAVHAQPSHDLQRVASYQHFVKKINRVLVTHCTEVVSMHHDSSPKTRKRTLLDLSFSCDTLHSHGLACSRPPRLTTRRGCRTLPSPTDHNPSCLSSSKSMQFYLDLCLSIELRTSTVPELYLQQFAELLRIIKLSNLLIVPRGRIALIKNLARSALPSSPL